MGQSIFHFQIVAPLPRFRSCIADVSKGIISKIQMLDIKTLSQHHTCSGSKFKMSQKLAQGAKYSLALFEMFCHHYAVAKMHFL